MYAWCFCPSSRQDKTGSFVIATKNEFSRYSFIARDLSDLIATITSCPFGVLLSGSLVIHIVPDFLSIVKHFCGCRQPVHGSDFKELLPCLSFDLTTMYHTTGGLSSTFCGPVWFFGLCRSLTGKAIIANPWADVNRFLKKILCHLRIHLYSNHFVRRFALCSVLIFVQF